MLFVLIILITLILQLFLPWWIIALVAFAVCFWWGETSGKAFSAAFMAIFVLWVCKALLETIPNENILANRVAQLFMLPQMSFNWLILLIGSGLIGGLVAGLAGMSGYYARVAWFPKKALQKTA